MKKLCLSLLCLCLVVACIILLPTPAYAVTEGDYTYEVSNGGATILAVNYKISGDVVIPATLGGYPVRMIGDRAFSGCNSMTSVVIPEGVTRIGNEAFYSCYNLTSISIPESLISIGNGVFSSCNSLTYATYDGARYLGNEDNPYLVLMGADAKTRSIADTTKLLYDSAFANRKELDNLSIPDSVIYVGSSCFYGCDSLTYATYDGAQYLGNAENPYMILVKASAETRSIADTTKIICGSAFQDSKGLTAITVPEGVVGIESMRSLAAPIWKVFPFPAPWRILEDMHSAVT